MGNCCGSQAVSEDYHYTSTAAPRSQKTSSSRSAVHGPGRTLGAGPSASSDTPDARTSAAMAAERRHNEAGRGGKLASQLAADRGKSSRQHLKDASTERQAQSRPDPLQWD